MVVGTLRAEEVRLLHASARVTSAWGGALPGLFTAYVSCNRWGNSAAAAAAGQGAAEEEEEAPPPTTESGGAFIFVLLLKDDDGAR